MASVGAGSLSMYVQVLGRGGQFCDTVVTWLGGSITSITASQLFAATAFEITTNNGDGDNEAKKC